MVTASKSLPPPLQEFSHLISYSFALAYSSFRPVHSCKLQFDHSSQLTHSFPQSGKEHLSYFGISVSIWEKTRLCQFELESWLELHRTLNVKNREFATIQQKNRSDHRNLSTMVGEGGSAKVFQTFVTICYCLLKGTWYIRNAIMFSNQYFVSPNVFSNFYTTRWRRKPASTTSIYDMLRVCNSLFRKTHRSDRCGLLVCWLWMVPKKFVKKTFLPNYVHLQYHFFFKPNLSGRHLKMMKSEFYSSTGGEDIKNNRPYFEGNSGTLVKKSFLVSETTY